MTIPCGLFLAMNLAVAMPSTDPSTLDTHGKQSLEMEVLKSPYSTKSMQLLLQALETF